MQTAIPATLMRGGTSRGLYIDSAELPADIATRDAVLLAMMGSPDVRQIDGIGGAHPLTSKVAVLSPPSRSDADVDYLFLQVAVDSTLVSDGQNCGNILAGVGAWAIEQGLVNAMDGETVVRIHMVNSGSMALATIQTPAAKVSYSGDARIDGVPGSAAPVALDFLDVAGSKCGSLLPTGNLIDVVTGIELTCIDNGMPVVMMRAADVGKTGYEEPAELESDTRLKAQLEEIRWAIGSHMNLGDVSNKTIPKMCLLAAPQDAGSICTRNFIPHRVHEAIGVLGAVSVATACVIPGTVADGLANIDKTDHPTQVTQVNVEHPTGSFSVAMALTHDDDQVQVKRSALLRTTRKLFKGEIYIPSSVWHGHA
ncbi:MAG: 4-oxalomesaconate tautomerase [Granulosicoccus sp.]